MKNIKKVIKRLFLKMFNPVAIKMGYVRTSSLGNENQTIDKNSLLAIFFQNLIKMGFNPKHIIDVGANHGTWTRETLKYFPNAYYTLLEPQKWLKPSMQDLLDANPKISFKGVGAGEQSGSFNFTIVDRDDSCSFRYTEEEAKEKGYKQVEIPIITLNELVQESKLPFPDIVKIDAEGLDLKVLDGASDLMGKTEVFLVEAALFYKGFDNNLLDMINYMDTKGYVLFEITDLNRPFEPQVLWLVELAFVKRGGMLDSFKINY